MELSGTLEAKYDTKEFASGFKKREFVINTGGDYPQTIKIEAHKDNITKLDGISVGSDITCAININGRLWEGNYYNNIVAWKIETGVAKTTKSVAVEDSDDGLPF
jgi:hypothetical protein